MKNLKQKFESDYDNYITICKKVNESPRSQYQDFYKHREYILKKLTT